MKKIEGKKTRGLCLLKAEEPLDVTRKKVLRPRTRFEMFSCFNPSFGPKPTPKSHQWMYRLDERTPHDKKIEKLSRNEMVSDLVIWTKDESQIISQAYCVIFAPWTTDIEYIHTHVCVCLYIQILEWEKPRTVSLCRLGGCAFAQWVSVWIFYTWCTTKMSFFVFCVLRLKNVQEKRREGSVHQIQALYGDFPWTPKKCSLETFAFLKTCARVRVYIYIMYLTQHNHIQANTKGSFFDTF